MVSATASRGADPLQQLLGDDSVETIDLNGARDVWITYADRRGRVAGAPVALTDRHLVELVDSLIRADGSRTARFAVGEPPVEAVLPDGSRVAAVVTPSGRPHVTIRRNRLSSVFLDRVPAGVGGGVTLLGLGTVTGQLAAFLAAAVAARCNLVLAGPAGAGKTTLLRALVHTLPPSERLVCVERRPELGLDRHPGLHPDLVELGADGHSEADQELRRLIRFAPRLNPSRVIVPELTGPEATDLLSLMSQGGAGCLTTVRARDAAEALGRLAGWAARDGLGLDAAHTLVAAAVDFVVVIGREARPGARHLVGSVVELTGCSGNRVETSRVFGPAADRRAARDGTVAILRRARLAEAGYRDDDHPTWFHAVGQG